jgi:hypothetical protein
MSTALVDRDRAVRMGGAPRLEELDPSGWRLLRGEDRDEDREAGGKARL